MPFTSLCGLVVIDDSRFDHGTPIHIPVPLSRVHIDARVVNFISQVEVTQKYINKEKNPIEAVYFFPVEESAAVVKFTAKLEGREIETQVKEKQQSREEYLAAVNNKKTAFLLEETKPDIFQVNVGHLSPGAECEVTIVYLSELPVEDGKTRLTIPTTIAPKYVPAEDNSEEASKIASIQYDFATPAALSITIDTIMKSPIKDISSPSHDIKSEIESEPDSKHFFKSSTIFNGSTSDMDRDIILLVDTDEPNKPKLVLEKDDNGSIVAMLSFVPSFDLANEKAELIFLIDCSGSMRGNSIALARDALHLFLNSLPVDCYFNVFQFGSRFSSLFPSSQKYDDSTLAEAKNLASKLDANFGGTEILRPIESILESPLKPGFPKQLFVMTDGAVSNSEACINLVKQHRNTARVFTLGIGSGTDRHLVKGMARAGQGTSSFVTYGEKIAPKVLKQLKNSLQPCINNIVIDWGDGNLQPSIFGRPVIDTVKSLMGFGKVKREMKVETQAPFVTPAVYDGSRLLVYRKYATVKQLQTVKISAETSVGKLDLEVPFEEENFLEGIAVHQMFARKLIQDLEEDGSSLRETISPHDKDQVKKLIVDLGTKYHIASSETSFVGVDEMKNCDVGVMSTRQVKNQINQGYGGGIASPILRNYYGGRLGQVKSLRSRKLKSTNAAESFSSSEVQLGITRRRCCAHASPHPSSVYSSYENVADSPFQNLSVSQKVQTAHVQKFIGIISPKSENMHPKEASSDSKLNNLIELTSLQIANGSFKRSQIIADLIKKSLSDIDAEAKKNGLDEIVWVTAIALAILHDRFSEDKDSWEMISDKAIKWIRLAGQEPDDVFKLAKSFVLT